MTMEPRFPNGLALGFATYFIATALPAIIATVVDDQLLANGVSYYAFAISGILAYSIFALQFILAARPKWLEQLTGAPILHRLHRSMAVVGSLFVCLHLVLLVWRRGGLDLLVDPWVGWPIQVGRLAVLALLATLAISFGRKRIRINNADWRFFHGVLAWTVLLSGSVHGVVLGSSFQSPFFAITWLGYLTVAVLAWLAMQQRRKKRLEARKPAR